MGVGIPVELCDEDECDGVAIPGAGVATANNEVPVEVYAATVAASGRGGSVRKYAGGEPHRLAIVGVGSRGGNATLAEGDDCIGWKLGIF